MDPAKSLEIPAGVPRPALETAGYAEGSVVSRVLLKRGGGSITAFAFDKGQGLTEHTSSLDALVHVLEGEADLSIADSALRASAGEIVLLPANVPHALTARTPFKMLLTMLRPA
jgi:quercetin dioxygenase-like cupin family protein